MGPFHFHAHVSWLSRGVDEYHSNISVYSILLKKDYLLGALLKMLTILNTLLTEFFKVILYWRSWIMGSKTYWTKIWQFKRTVSRELRCLLLNINLKLLLRADVIRHKILILLKGRFTIYTQKTSSSREFWCGGKHVP